MTTIAASEAAELARRIQSPAVAFQESRSSGSPKIVVRDISYQEGSLLIACRIGLRRFWVKALIEAGPGAQGDAPPCDLEEEAKLIVISLVELAEAGDQRSRWDIPGNPTLDLWPGVGRTPEPSDSDGWS